MASLIYDATLAFCEQFIEKCSPARDQMIAAARSGRQQIAKCGRASREEEWQRINEARANLDGLLSDYQDFLLHPRRPLAPEAPCGPGAGGVASAAAAGHSTVHRQIAVTPWLEHATVVANAVIALIRQANDLLDRHIAGLECPCTAETDSCERSPVDQPDELDTAEAVGPAESTTGDVPG